MTHAPGGRNGIRRVLIAGAGNAGELIAAELRRRTELGLIPVGFLDDATAKQGRDVAGLPVLGRLQDLISVLVTHRVDELIVAMPSATGDAIRKIHRVAQTAGLPTRTVPTLLEIVSGRVSVSALRPIQIEDLLRREPLRSDLVQVGEMVHGATVLVTGAGGSIGVELCRQVAILKPARLVLLGHGENSIFNAIREFSARYPTLELIPRIVDVRNEAGIRRVMHETRPGVVLHNAAHKHVPLMETNVAEAVTNNVLGTRVVADASVAADVACFVMVSTDKAVRPTSAMGASKRVAEQVIRRLAQRTERRLLSVRFGNVLGSRGSVLPIFLEQIEAGGPVTVTHPEMQRYFMTIPEAVQLTLQAAAIGAGGDVLVLDMGEPIRIADLAADLIRLSGLEPGRDVEIRFTGIRPGEKLYEEPFFGPDEADPTAHPKILRARNDVLTPDHDIFVDELLAAAGESASDDHMRMLLGRLVPDYSAAAVRSGPGGPGPVALEAGPSRP